MAKANNGNWQTANRWARFLRQSWQVDLVPATTIVLPAHAPGLTIALHARRSAAALAAYCAAFPSMPSILVLTGTDLYRDIRQDADAQQSLRLATRLVVLQEAGLQELPAELRAKASVIYQSAATLKPGIRRNTPRHFDVTMIGHLREEKDPATYLRAAALIEDASIRLFHVGAALDPVLGELARHTEQHFPGYRWLGSLPHAAARQHLKHCDLMVISSHMEGGANVIIEAVTCGVPVLASDISGNRGMLGADYAGYFPPGDSAALAALIRRAARDADFLGLLAQQCAQRTALFAPAAEKTTLLELVDNCVIQSTAGNP